MGFYVAVVVGRWWQQYLAIPWPDRYLHQLLYGELPKKDIILIPISDAAIK